MSISLDLSRASAPVKTPVNLSGLTRDELRQALIDAEICPPEKAKMRASQVWRWIHHYGVTDFALMSDVAKDTRAKLAEAFTLARPEIVERQVSKDGTRKWLIRTAPGIEIETVYIPDVGRAGALCVSSQVGCTLNCTFCHTGTQKLVRNLTTAEIVAQVQVARDDLDEWPSPKEDRRLSNIVFMGMGEPLYNLDHVANAIDIISDNEGIALSRRRITVSTSGVVPQLNALGERTAAMLAISLHATNDPLRDQLVPLNKKYPLDQLMAAIRAYPGLSNARRVTFEYVMLKGVNDSPAEARALIKLIEGIPSKVNLIPFNPWPGTDYQCSDWKTIETFAAILNKAGYASPIRTPRGRDILAACGQLKSESEKLRASARLKAEREEADAA
ncbi:Ribosomal RNA large subunit methyltransferase N [Brevundimonas diminuta]|uniref:Dual-specificity RNA methyltransferase RlmN n=1 Tax=Brevundimonas diminuta TaxID=293 RepID=A0A246KJ16_BREDI|nr:MULTISPECIES: 23S rRNA (adenine(2503)-C(2))-methyltransferase RlmN [Brevundimonas]OJU51896.1 MAG: 23S rRNA (adenine(2503)-C(2))-methyltransferase [Brevundimonas sp. 67-6]ASD26695.1 23S rRNA (adenine(2503)-C(2))-methyltransferase RlmN [Brevundimonas diminuta]EGF95828.1 radical SAM superfamily protein [Brevundimonas diminuta ATCC 11568]OMG60197.1 23S rRNA (adenine(2503)-C(2))-methyltransferase RlmN [Brevundimonas sp. ZS04]OWR23021.1 23S rRNA (adenine(2503)-C(2))-methyltransferase RlmN [Brevun